jgi:hypothetical protein
MPSTANGYRYPAASDPVAQGATAIQNLAQDVDDLNGRGAFGKVDIVGTGTTSATVSVTFPAGRFTQPPSVVASCANSLYYASPGGPVTASGMSLSIRRGDQATFTATVNTAWIARGT